MNPPKDTTQGCLPFLPEGKWKRVSKYQYQHASNLRLFQCGDTVRAVIYDSYDEEYRLLPVVLTVKHLPVIQALRTAAARIRHGGDYGFLYFHPDREEALWIGGDGDGYVEAGHTGFDEICEWLRVPGVSVVQYEAEDGPDGEEGYDGYLPLGIHGITVRSGGLFW